jgi:brefeldin A-inhibited guanine nucleotide-exchange protein
VQVFTTAATDEHKSIVLLAFETIEKIVREYFPYITETETTTFTDCVNCLIAFTNSRFDKDVSLNAIAFLRFCALKLAEGELGAAASTKDVKSAASSPKQTVQESPTFTDKDESLYFWFPLLAGLSELTFDPRPDIRKSALEVLFDTLRFH